MKKLIIALSFVLFSGFAFGQGTRQGGNTQLNLGFGLSDYGLPFYLGFDSYVSRDVTLGAEASFRAYREDWDHHYYDHNIIGISGNANYHFNNLFHITPRWDLYAGANVGFYYWSSPYGYYGNHNSGLGLGGQIGARYFFTNNLGINLEFGGGNAFSGGKIGLTIRL